MQHTSGTQALSLLLPWASVARKSGISTQRRRRQQQICRNSPPPRSGWPEVLLPEITHHTWFRNLLRGTNLSLLSLSLSTLHCPEYASPNIVPPRGFCDFLCDFCDFVSPHHPRCDGSDGSSGSTRQQRGGIRHGGGRPRRRSSSPRP